MSLSEKRRFQEQQLMFQSMGTIDEVRASMEIQKSMLKNASITSLAKMSYKNLQANGSAVYSFANESEQKPENNSSRIK